MLERASYRMATIFINATTELWKFGQDRHKLRVLCIGKLESTDPWMVPSTIPCYRVMEVLLHGEAMLTGRTLWCGIHILHKVLEFTPLSWNARDREVAWLYIPELRIKEGRLYGPKTVSSGVLRLHRHHSHHLLIQHFSQRQCHLAATNVWSLRF